MTNLSSFPIENKRAVHIMRKMIEERCLDHVVDIEEDRHAHGVIVVKCDKDYIMHIQDDFSIFNRNLSSIDEKFRNKLEKEIEDNGEENYSLTLSRRLCWKTESGSFYHALSVFHYYVHFSPDEDYDYFSSMTPPPLNEKVVGVVSFNPQDINYLLIERVE